jgi:hypothetical protein
MLRVAGQVVEPRHAALVAKGIHRLRDPSGLESRGARGIGGVQTPTLRVFCGQLAVQLELLRQVAVAPPLEQGSPETLTPFAKNAHPISRPHASPRSNVWMMPTIRSHACRSLAS